jgi:chaperonin cofactor prefoldin
MAIGWLKAIQSVPWADVISNAPKVAEGAKGLWDRVAKKAGVDIAPEATTPTQDIRPPTELEHLHAELARLSQGQQQLASQLMSATELINTLAQQNQNLIERVDRLQSRLRWLLVTAGVVTAGVCAAAWKTNLLDLVGL